MVTVWPSVSGAQPGQEGAQGTYLIICGTVTLEFSSNAFIMSPLHRMLSTHWNQREDPWVRASVSVPRPRPSRGSVK